MAKVTQHEGKFLRFINEDGWEYVERRNTKAVVAVIATTVSGDIILGEQYRKAIDKITIDLPAGLCGDNPEHPDEDPAVAAIREMIEEVGYAPAPSPQPQIQKIAECPSSPGLSSEILTYYMARGVVKVGDGGGVDAGESITVHVVPIVAIDSWIEMQLALGKLIDPKVYAALYLVSR